LAKEIGLFGLAYPIFRFWQSGRGSRRLIPGLCRLNVSVFLLQNGENDATGACSQRINQTKKDRESHFFAPNCIVKMQINYSSSSAINTRWSREPLVEGVF